MTTWAPTPDSVLRAQIDRLAANLRRCSGALKAPSAGELPREPRDSLLVDLAEQERGLQRLRVRVTTDRPQEGLWEEFSDRDREADIRMAEALSLLEGAVVRRAGLDDGMCTIADALLDDLSDATGVSWVRFTTLAVQEFYAQRARIIHLRFPEYTVWALPLVGHEFGHLVAQELRQLRPDGAYEQIVETEIRDAAIPVPHAREIFADVFATYAFGPAYPCTAALLRFRPGGGPDQHATHPDDTKRVHVMLATLRAMSDELHSVDRPYGRVSDSLESAWAQLRDATEARPTLTEEDRAAFDYLVRQVFLPLLRARVPNARYDGWAAAIAARRAFVPGDDSFASRVIARADVLNAAWLERLDRWDEPDAVVAIGDTALNLMRVT